MQATTEQMEKVTQGMIKACDDMSQMACESLQATVQAVSAMSRSYEAIYTGFSNITKQSLAESMKVGQTLSGAKTLREVLDLQTTMVQSGLDFVMSEMSRITETTARATQDAMSPMAQTFNTAMTRISQARSA